MMTLLVDGSRTQTPADVPVTARTPAQRAWTVMHYIEDHPQEWRQKNWRWCYAGHTVRMFAPSRHGYNETEIMLTAMDLLDVGIWRAANLVAERNGTRRLRRLTRRYFGPDPYADRG